MKHHDIDTHHNFHDNHDKCDDHDHLERGDSPCQPPLPRSCPLLTSRLNSFLKNYFNFYCYLFVCLTFVCQLLSRHLSIFLDHSITSCVKILKITQRRCNAMFHRNPIQHGVQFLVHTPYVLPGPLLLLLQIVHYDVISVKFWYIIQWSLHIINVSCFIHLGVPVIYSLFFAEIQWPAVRKYSGKCMKIQWKCNVFAGGSML